MSMAAQPHPQILESKLRRPWVRPGIVNRAALVDRLLASHPVPVVSVVAPAGYGKTTLLSQWAERRGRTAWVSLDERDNDPEIMLACAAAALNRVEGIDPGLLRTRWLGGPSIAATAVTRLVGAMSAMAEPVALVLDHVEQVSNQECRDVVAESRCTCRRAAARDRQPWAAAATDGAAAPPDARSPRSRVDDLAMGRRRGAGPARGRGGDARTTPTMAPLLERTEGWPVGLYLGRAGHPGRRPRGDGRVRVHRRRSAHGRLPAVRAARPRLSAERGDRSSPGPRCSTG